MGKAVMTYSGLVPYRRKHSGRSSTKVNFRMKTPPAIPYSKSRQAWGSDIKVKRATNIKTVSEGKR